MRVSGDDGTESERIVVKADRPHHYRRLLTVKLAVGLSVFGVLAGCGASDPAIPSPPPASTETLPLIRLDAVERQLDPLKEWAQTRADKYRIPVRAAQAYGYAAVIMSKAQPSCHLGWTTLAGIARIESNHARFGGATISSEGTVQPPIRGVALNGTGGNATIIDLSESSRAGHTVYARAMGPFQFIPDTWQRWGIKANSDRSHLIRTIGTGKPGASQDLTGNPDNIDDAALAAGRYLCAAGGNLATAKGWQRAILAYNHSMEYLQQVRDTALNYSK